METSTIVESKYSSGINIVRRLDELWRNCHKFKRDGKYAKWNEELDTIWLELARDLFEKKKSIVEESKEFKEAKEKFESFELKLKKTLPFLDNGTGFKKPNLEDLKKRDEQYKILMEKQLFLARLENYIGKGTTEKEREDDWD